MCIRDRISIIDRMGYINYYLIVFDFINYAKSQGIPGGPGPVSYTHLSPYGDCIGHSESRRHRYDYDAVTKAFARCRKVVEINANSAVVRPGNEDVYKRQLRSAASYGDTVRHCNGGLFIRAEARAKALRMRLC